MKAVLVKPHMNQSDVQETRVVELSEPLYKSIHKEIGDYFEVVRPRRQMFKGDGICFVCDDNGLAKRLPLNRLATRWYKASPVVGPILILKEGMTDEGADFVPMTDEEISDILNTVTILTAIE